MFTMDQIHHIRQLYYEQDKYISEIARETDTSWKTVRKYVDMTDFICERFESDQSGLRPLPSVPFDTAGYQSVRTNKWGKFTLNHGLHEYSASPEYPEATLRVKLTSKEVIVMNLDNRIIVTHNRLYGKDDERLQSMKWLPCVAVIMYGASG